MRSTWTGSNLFPAVIGDHPPMHHALTNDTGVVGAVQDASVVPHHNVARGPRVPVYVVAAGGVVEQKRNGFGRALRRHAAHLGASRGVDR
ncbi:MAG: hypothetical protein WA630_29755 [Mycobacterium sp.]